MESIVLTWTEFKTYIAAQGFSSLLRYVNDNGGTTCKVWIYLSGKVIETHVTVPSADYTDFLSNYESLCNLEITGRF